MAGPSTAGLAALNAGEDWHYVGEAGEPAFQNSWANVSTTTKMAFRIREAGVVDIYGHVSGGTSAPATVVFTLPAGYRPSAEISTSIFGLAGSPATTAVPVLLTIATDGTVKPSGFSSNATSIWINTQIFLAPPVVA